MMNAVTNVANAVTVSPIFSDMPSWIKFVSAVILVVTSPAPSLSKKAMFWRKMAARYLSRIFWEIFSPEYIIATVAT